jgi:hypothetical protein
VIQLVCESNLEPTEVPPGVQRRAFKTPFALFLAYATSPLVTVAPKSTLRATANEFVPQILRRVDQKPENEIIEGSHVQGTHEPEHQRQPTVFLDESNLEDPFSENERDAVRTIETWYLRLCQRISSRSNPSPLDRWFNECHSVVMRKSAGFLRPYRATFLGPLPHLLLCIDAFRRHTEEQRFQASKIARTVDPSNLEGAMERLGNIM